MRLDWAHLDNQGKQSLPFSLHHKLLSRFATMFIWSTAFLLFISESLLLTLSTYPRLKLKVTFPVLPKSLWVLKWLRPPSDTFTQHAHSKSHRLFYQLLLYTEFDISLLDLAMNIDSSSLCMLRAVGHHPTCFHFSCTIICSRKLLSLLKWKLK